MHVLVSSGDTVFVICRLHWQTEQYADLKMSWKILTSTIIRKLIYTTKGRDRFH